MESAGSKLWYLMNMDIFSGLRQDEYAIIDRDSSSLCLKKREALYFQGTGREKVYFLKKGKIKLVKATEDGRTVALDILKNGTLFGELSSVGGDDEGLTAEAIEDCLLCVMKKQNFDHLIDTVPHLSKRVTKLIGLRLKRIEGRLLDLLYCTIEKRLAKTLLKLSEDFGVQKDGRTTLNIKLTHNDLAEIIGSTRETVTATLGNFRQRGLIDYVDRYIIIVNIEKLKTLAEI
jgi:CRP-like cAMP-binding protein